MARRDRARRPARRAPFKEARPLILICCEGEVTEKDYIEGFANACRNPRVRYVIPRETGEPLPLVKYAVNRKTENLDEAKSARDDNLRYDQIWCVIDVDGRPVIPEVRDLARAKGIRLAISNPCVELWLLLHFRESPGMHDSRTLQKLMDKHVPGYDKRVNYQEHYAQGYAQAVKRAKRMANEQERAGTPGENPTTNFYDLTESIQGEDTPRT